MKDFLAAVGYVVLRVGGLALGVLAGMFIVRHTDAWGAVLFLLVGLAVLVAMHLHGWDRR